LKKKKVFEIKRSVTIDLNDCVERKCTTLSTKSIQSLYTYIASDADKNREHG